MAWYVITSYPGQERKIRNAVSEENKNYSQPFEVYILPVRNVLLHLDKSRENQKIGMVFIRSDSAEELRDLLSVLSFKYNFHCHLMYDRINKQSLVVPESQMELFKEVHPEEIEELLLLSKPFRDYAAHNERYVIIDGPLKGLEGYKINLHKDKKLAVELGGMTLAINNIYSYKIARVFEPNKDPLFAHQQKDRMICHLIGTLQVNGFPDDAYKVLRFLLKECHEHKDIITFEASLKDKQNWTSVLHENIDVVKLQHYLSLLDAVTAGYLQSLSQHFYQEYENPDFKELIPEQRILPFLTPTSGVLNDSKITESIIHHKDFTEYIRLVNIKERRLFGKKSKEVKFSYYSHVGITNNLEQLIFSSFDQIREYFDLLPQNSNDNLECYLSDSIMTLEQIIEAPRCEATRKFLPNIIIR